MKTQWPLELNEPTPFKGLSEYDRIIGEQCKENATWRKIAKLSMTAFFLSLAVVVYALTLPKERLLVVTVSDWGEAKYAGDVSKFNYQNIKVPEIAIQYQLRKFIINMYSIPQDAEVLRSNLRDCYSALTSTSAAKLSNQLRENNPFDDFGSVNKTVEIETVLQLSKNSYQADFITRTSRPDLSDVESTRMRAVLTTKLMEPPKQDQILNPLGIYITNFDAAPIGDVKQ